MSDLHLAELRVWDPAISGLRTLRYGNRGYVTGPTATPANVYFDPRIKAPANLARTCFAAGTTQGRSTVGVGDLVLLNGDGELDALCGYGFDGRELIQWHATADSPVFPDDFEQSVATMDGVEVTRDVVTVRVRDRQLETAVALQPNKYAGDNVLPDGLEGVADDLLGKPKPVCHGAASNVPAVCVNTSKLIYQVADGPVASVGAVYDRGIELNTGHRWTGSTPFTDRINAIGYDGAGTWVAVENGTRKVFTSVDGVSWNDEGALGSVPVAVDWDGTYWAVLTYTGHIFTAPDPTGAWTDRGAKLSGGAYGLCWAAPLALWIATGTTGEIYTAPDPTGAWTSRTSGTTEVLGSVVASDVLAVACSQLGTIVSSEDGITWTTRYERNAPGSALNSVTSDGEAFLAVGEILCYSADGVVWQRYTPPFAAGSSNAVKWTGKSYLLAGTAANQLYSSEDGATWTELTSAGAFGGVVVASIGADGAGNAVTGGAADGKYGYTVQTTYANAADLENDELAPGAGEFLAYLAGGHFRLGSTPAGLVTADVTAGDTAADRTAAQIFGRLLSPPLGTPLEFSAADIAALDAASNDVLGFWRGTEEMTVAEACDAVAASVGAWWGVDRSGVFRVQQFVAPAAPALATFVMSDIISLERLAQSDPGRGVPAWMTRVRYARNHAVQTTDLAGGVTDVRRGWLAKEWREATASDATIQLAHPLAPEWEEDSLLTASADAAAEATRRLALRGVQRERYDLVVALNDETETLDLGQVVHVTHDRFGLSAGAYLRIIGREPVGRELRLTIWK